MQQSALAQYILPEFSREAPRSWVSRLREISPVVDRMSHLRFRWLDPRDHWSFNERGVWMLYSCTPRACFTPGQAEKFKRHWSEMGSEGERLARQSQVSSYQHFMWHNYGVEARPYLILQGEHGGTPAMYTRREARYLDGIGARSEPLPPGVLPPCPFDERTIKSILARDRFIAVGQKFEELEKLDSVRAQAQQDAEAERVFRKEYLDTWLETHQAQADFLKTYLRTKEADHALPRASRATADAVSQWKDVWKDTGTVIGARAAAARPFQSTVSAAVTS